MAIWSKVPRTYRKWMKARFIGARNFFVRTMLSYDGDRLLATLRSLGVRPGDSVMLHAGFGSSGFRGSVESLTNVFLDAVGPDGNLLMVSMPYGTSTLEYLATLKQFDVRKTPSMMGLVSEFFRRRPGVVRSEQPTHPVLARGARAEWFVEGHDATPYPCGPGSPFERLAEVDGMVIFFNVAFETFTFFHYLEHLIHQELPFPLYTPEPFDIPMIDRAGVRRTVRAYAYTPEAIARRRPPILKQALRERKFLHERRIGNTRLIAVRVRDAIDCVRDMSKHGQYFYDMTPRD